MQYSVSIEARGASGGPLIADAVIGAFVEAIKPHAGIAGFGQGYPSWGATITVEATTPVQAVTEASVILRRIAIDVGLPDWPYVMVAAVREDVLGESVARPPA